MDGRADEDEFKSVGSDDSDSKTDYDVNVDDDRDLNMDKQCNDGELSTDRGRGSTNNSSEQTCSDAAKIKSKPGYISQHSDNFTCCVCYELMVEPTTLQCGHSFCRSCLAEWFFSSKKQICPTCRQPYWMLPRVSVALRSTMEKILGESYKMRKQLVSTPHAIERVAKFEKRFTGSFTSGPAVSQVPGLNRDFQPAGNLRDKNALLGIAIIAVTTITVWSAFSWLLGFGNWESTASKPMSRWSEADAMEWLTQIGSWAESALGENFTNMHIDGSLLMAMKQDDLESISGDIDDLHKRAFIAARDAALELGSKPPADLWEYKDLHLFKCSWAVYAFQDYPRLSVFYLWLFDYEAGFLPLIHSTCPVMDMEFISLYTHQFEAPTAGQWLDFSFRWFFVPHLGIFGDFILRNVWYTNAFTSIWFLLCLLSLTVVEVLSTAIMLMSNLGFVRATLSYMVTHTKMSAKLSFVYLAVYVLWNLVPTIAANLFIYGTVFFSSLVMVTVVKKHYGILKGLHQERTAQHAAQVKVNFDEIMREAQQELQQRLHQD